MNTFIPSNKMIFETVSQDKSRLNTFIKNLEGSSWVFDLSQVHVCDSAGIALLIEAQRLSQVEKISCEFRGVTDKIHSLIEFFGVEEVLR